MSGLAGMYNLSDLTHARCPECDGRPERFEARTGTDAFELSIDAQRALVPDDRVVWLR